MSVLSPPYTGARTGSGTRTTVPSPAGPPGRHRADQEDGALPRLDVVPVRAPGLELLGELPGSGYRQPPGLVRRADGQTCQLTRLLYLILEAVDGRRGYAEIAAVVSATISRLVTGDNVRMLTEAKLRPLGLLQGDDGTVPEARKANPLLALRFRLVVSNPRVTRRLTAPFAVLFRPFVVVVALAAFLSSTGWVLFEKGLASATHQAFDRPGLLLLVFAITIVSAGFHEFGHAAACRYGGATPGAMGVGLYLVWPAFYTNVDDSYRLGRAGRLRVDLGGLYFNAIVAVAMFAAWAATRWDALLLVMAAQVLQMLRQLAPFVRFDGYHILADLTGVPDLYSRITPTLRGLLPTRWGRPECTVLKPWARLVVTLWVLIVVPMLLLSMALMVKALPRVIATAWQSLQNQSRLLTAAWAAGDPALIGVRLLSILAVCLPVLGTVYLLVRLVRRTVRSVWRATAGRPSRRLAAIAVGGALVAALVWTWWPDEVKYQPVQGNERGTITESLFAAHPRPPEPPDRTLTVGERRTVTTVWPRTAALPAPDQKRLALVLVPRGRGSADGSTQPPAWVFPFNPPAPPGEGDNQALAVNTRDGSTVYDVAFALVWATDGTVDSRNEAYAFASCQGCRTVAVAFQVVLVAGQADVVVPKNIAAAVNYSCRDCLTSAVASQLVLTGMDRLSDDTRRRLTAIWQKIEQFGQQVQTLTPQEVSAQLEQYKKEILAAVGKDPVVAPTTGAPRTTGSPESRPTTAPAPTGTSAAASEQTVTTEPTTADQSSTTPPTTSAGTPPPSVDDTTTPPETSSPATSAEPTPFETATADPAGDSGVVAG